MEYDGAGVARDRPNEHPWGADGHEVIWHNGENDYSYAEIALLPDDGLMVFPATSSARNNHGWNLEEAALAQGIVDRLRS